MSNNFTDESGNQLSDEQLSAAVQSGTLSAKPGTRVHMLDATGRPVTVAAEEAGQALAAGYQPEPSAAVEARATSKRYGTAGQKAITAVEGAGRGLTFGLSDIVASELGGDEYRASALARQRENPITAGAGEVAGALAPALVSGGSSLAARVVSAPSRAAMALGRGALPFATPATAAGRMALRAAQTGIAGAFEGALYGAGSTAGKLALQGDELTAEKVLSGGAHGALLGGVIGAAAGAIAGRLERAATTADDKLMSAKLDDIATSLRKQGQSEAAITRRLQKEAAKTQQKSGLLDRFAERQAIKQLKPSPSILRRHAQGAPDVDSLLREAGQDYLSYQMRTGELAGKRIFHGAKDPIDALDDIQHAFAETDDILRQHKSMVRDVMAKDPTFRPDVGDVVGRVQDDLGKLGEPNLTRRLAKEHIAPLREVAPGTELDALELARSSIDDALARGAKPAEARVLRQMRHVVDDAASSATDKALTQLGVDPTIFRQEARWHRSLGFVQDLVEELKLAQHVEKGMDSTAAGFALGAILSGNIGVGAITGFMQSQARQFVQNRIGGVAADLAHKVSRADLRLGWGAKALAGDGFRYPVRSALIRPLTGEAARKYFDSLGQLASDPRKRGEYVAAQAQGVTNSYPELGSIVMRKLDGDLQYLGQQIPPRHTRAGASLTPLAESSVGARKADREFWERAAALEDPGYVVDEILSGRVPRAAIEALKERRPLVWEQLRRQVAEETALLGTKLPFKRRINLGLAFDFPADKSLMPGRMAEIQATMMPAPTGVPSGPGLPQGPGAPQTSGAIKANEGTAQAMQLPSEV